MHGAMLYAMDSRENSNNPGSSNLLGLEENRVSSYGKASSEKLVVLARFFKSKVHRILEPQGFSFLKDLLW